MRHLTVSEAAEALKLSVPTIKRYIYEGQLKSTKLPGGQHRIPESEIERLLALRGDSPVDGASPAPAASAEERVAVLERWVAELEAEVERLTNSLQVISRYCAGKCERARLTQSAPHTEQIAHRVAVLGPACRRCKALADITTEILCQTGHADLAVERVSDFDDIAAYGPILTPALLVDDELVVSGRVPTRAALKSLLDKCLAGGGRLREKTDQEYQGD